MVGASSSQYTQILARTQLFFGPSRLLSLILVGLDALRVQKVVAAVLGRLDFFRNHQLTDPLGSDAKVLRRVLGRHELRHGSVIPPPSSESLLTFPDFHLTPLESNFTPDEINLTPEESRFPPDQINLTFDKSDFTPDEIKVTLDESEVTFDDLKSVLNLTSPRGGIGKQESRAFLSNSN